MPDISMCQNKDCSKSKDCWRFMAVPSEWQSYCEFKEICHVMNNYKWFYKIDGKPIRKED